MKHVHEDEHPSEYGVYEVCRCGASRTKEPPGKEEQWHLCERCARRGYEKLVSNDRGCWLAAPKPA